MTTIFKGYKQDMPPKGGYRPINVKRTFPKLFLTPTKLWFLHIAPTVLFCSVFTYYNRLARDLEVENRSGNIALEPLLWAECDRDFLKQVRKNRDEEKELMKNVKDWEVGKYYNEPVYFTADPDQWIRPLINEYYTFASDKSLSDYANYHLWT